MAAGRRWRARRVAAAVGVLAVAVTGARMAGARAAGPIDLPQQGTTIDQAVVYQFVASPNYAHDHVVFASGQFFDGCLRVPGCTGVFRSNDGGTTWTTVSTDQGSGGDLLLPPSYPKDSRIFQGAPNASPLGVSTDGGATFLPLASPGRNAAMSPGFSSGDRRILSGEVPTGWEYHDDLGVATPLTIVPTAMAGSYLTFSFAPHGHSMLVGGNTDPTAVNSPDAVTACSASACAAPVHLAGSIDGNTPHVLASQSFGPHGLAYAWVIGNLYRSTDGGASFQALATPTAGQIQGLTEGPDGSLYMAIYDGSGGFHPGGGVFKSTDQGSTWSKLGVGTDVDTGLWSLAVAPDGRIFVGLGVFDPGIRCSADGGQTWARRC